MTSQSFTAPIYALNVTEIPIVEPYAQSFVPIVSDVPSDVMLPVEPIPELMPVRMLAEFAYCPRLGYMEWVQGEWAENIETKQGTFGHRNVDKPDTKPIPEPVESVYEKQHARSITLSSENEGLIAKLDILEIDGNIATPVDYKRGVAPNIPEGAYEAERIQLCAQGLILRDNGYLCNEGIIYYIASKQRITVVFDEALIAKTRELCREFRNAAENSCSPPPLDDSPKCPKCSLVGICLPDEVNLISKVTSDDLSAKPVLRQLLPALEHALPFYVQTQGAFIGKSGERLTVKLKGEQLADIRIIDVSQVCVFGNIMFSAQAISELTNRGIPILHFSYGGWFHSITTSLIHKNVELRIRQYQAAEHLSGSLNIARQFISGKVKNSRTLLRRHLKNNPQCSVNAEVLLRDLKELNNRILKADSIPALLGLEGFAAKLYFSAFFQFLPGHVDFDVRTRNRRPPKDPINAVLSFVYSMLTKELTIATQSVGFDPMLGFLHQPRYGRPSLALDLAEEFRPIIADSVTLTVFNNEEVNADSFVRRMGYVVMTDSARKSIIAAFERRMNTEIIHPLFGYKITYRRVLEVQARILARYLLGEFSEYIPFTVR
ncbi:MAG: CRISPR-associated endonuclease Cas4g/Cas1g [Thermoguttaceae bacterium]